MDTRFYGAGLAKLDVGTELPGSLIVVEGADGVGRSTHIELLQGWLEGQGFAVASTGLVRSALTRRGIESAKEGHSFDRTTMSLFYATDLADRLEHEIVPALRSGFVVLADRYVFTTMARGSARGLDREWLAKLYGFALVPRRVFFLRLDPDELIRRTLRRGGELDYWEAGRDIGLAPDLYTSFRKYQTLILEEFDRMAGLYGFTTIDASRTVEEVQAELRREVANLLDPSLLTPTVDVADD
ncbi:MAG TPA: thymidylate kinase [Gemmatimonadales bacterium]|nr:thymidylate kinase [Gemmatimonadales bacterium]